MKQKIDHFLIENNVFERLLKEYNLHKKIVVAYDFDNTVYDYHNQGHIYNQVIKLIRRCKANGFELIVFTGSHSTRIEYIKKYLTENNIPFDRINENPIFFKSDSRKIFYNILLDDRAGLLTSYKILNKLLNLIEKKDGNC